MTRGNLSIFFQGRPGDDGLPGIIGLPGLPGEDGLAGLDGKSFKNIGLSHQRRDAVS